MQEYPVKRGQTKDLVERMVRGLRETFGAEPVEQDGRYRIAYGALKRLEVWPGEKNKTVFVDTESDINADDDLILDTNKKFRLYLDLLTGFSTKERVKRAKPKEE
ncbi:MAG: hypothetical protein D5R99_07715 [Methanocalculus sp. MSAO_Arc1]|uniref:DUF5611 family protein n=1 Tax=Methanocalculus TaxID=71151 RepID=UPI000FEF7609|nr:MULTISPECIES: DUF5611 family protein [unclassified Methanocalculus]MCP1662023.1 hypothetical protein [Methanocalculus sp. AMF5]RQD79611.1 MAG: hypothetical protein D5R99_07715 [Methanocalculus sp. MSAO_Arc1]